MFQREKHAIYFHKYLHFHKDWLLDWNYNSLSCSVSLHLHNDNCRDWSYGLCYHLEVTIFVMFCVRHCVRLLYMLFHFLFDNLWGSYFITTSQTEKLMLREAKQTGFIFEIFLPLILELILQWTYRTNLWSQKFIILPWA